MSLFQYFWKRVQPSLTYPIQSNISYPYLPKMTNFYLNSLQHTHFAQKPCFHSSSPFCAVISPKATILPKRPHFHLKSFCTLIFCISPVFTLTVQISPKCFFRTLIFPKSPIFPQNAHICSKSLKHTDFPQLPSLHTHFP